MAVSWTEWKASNLRICWHDGAGNLKPSSTTSLYTGGDPTSPNQIKPSIVDASNNLKKGLTDPTDSFLKPSLQPANGGGADPNVITVVVAASGDLRGARASTHPSSFGSLSPTSWQGLLIWEISADTSNSLIVLEFGNGGGQQIPGVTTVRAAWDNGTRVEDYTFSAGRYIAGNSSITVFLDSQVGNATDVVLTAL